MQIQVKKKSYPKSLRKILEGIASSPVTPYDICATVVSFCCFRLSVELKTVKHAQHTMIVAATKTNIISGVKFQWFPLLAVVCEAVVVQTSVVLMRSDPRSITRNSEHGQWAFYLKTGNVVIICRVILL